jgi:hypothetical protein
MTEEEGCSNYISFDCRYIGFDWSLTFMKEALFMSVGVLIIVLLVLWPTLLDKRLPRGS